MKRDMDLCRKILLKLEEAPDKTGWTEIEFDEYSQEEIAYHVMLLKEARLIEAIDVSKGAFNNWKAKRLTWEGHEFLDAARDNRRWEKAKSAMAQAGGFALDVMKQLLIQYLKQDLKLT